MKKFMKHKYLITVFVLLITVGIGLNLPITKQYGAQYISKTISQALGSYVDVQQVELRSFNSAGVKDLVVKDKNNQVFLQAKDVEVTVSLWDMITGREVAGITAVEITDPVVNLQQNSEGKWNYESFLEDKKSTSSAKFQGKIMVENGAVNLDLQGKKISTNKIAGTVDLADYNHIDVNVSGFVKNGYYQVKGQVGEDGHYNLKIKGNDFILKDYLEFIPGEYLDKVSLDDGKLAYADLRVTKPVEGDLNLQGNVKLADLALKYEDYTVSQGDVLVNLQNNQARFFLKAQVNGEKLKASGNVYSIFKEPTADAVVEADSFTILDYNLKNIKLNLAYEQDKIYLNKGSFNFGQGSVDGKGYYDLNSTGYGLEAEVSKLDLFAIKELAPYNLGGSLTGKILAEGMATDFNNLKASIDGKVKSALVANIPWQEISFSLNKNGPEINLGALNGELLAGGSITAKGKLIDNKILGDVFGTDVNLNLVNNYLPSLRLKGQGNLYAKVQGTVDNPQAEVIFDGSKGSVVSRSFDDLRFKGHVSKDKIIIHQASLSEDNRPIYQAQGEVNLNTGSLDLQVETQRGRVENLLAAAMVNLPLTGNFNNTMMITGSINKPKVTGHFQLWDGGYDGILLQSIAGDYELDNGIIHLPDLAILTPFLQGSIQGQISTAGEFDLDINGERINMARLPIKYPYPITGEMEFKGQLKGSMTYPIFTGELAGDEITFNHQGLKNVHSNISFRDNLLQVEDFKFNLGEGSFNLNAKYNVMNNWLFVVAQVQNVDSKAALAMANLENEILHGKFNGTGEITGSLNSPKIHLEGEMPKGYLKEFPLQNIQLEITYGDKVLELKKFFGQQNDGKVGAVGKLDFNRQTIEGQLSANNVNPNIFVGLAGYDFKINGSLNGDLQVRGKINRPEADFSVYLQGDGKEFDQGYILGNLKNNIIYINQGVLSRGKSALKTYGTIPLAAFNSKQRQGNMQDQMNMKMYLENTDLDLLPNFFPMVQWATGQVKGDVQITGTVAKPYFAGSISTADAAIKFKDLTKPFTDINGNIVLKGERISIENFNANLGKGYLKIQGFLQADGYGLKNYEGRVIARGLEVDSPYYKGLLNGDVKVAPKAYRGQTIPELKVNFVFNNITVSMPPLPEASDAPLPLIALDINVAVGDNVRAYNPLLYDIYLSGGFDVRGTTRNPQASGEIVVTSGTINVLKNIFRVNVGSINFNQFNSFFPTLDFKASTKVGRTQVYVSLFGPVDKDLTTRLYSEPSMPEGDIIKLLAFRTNPNGSDDGDITQGDVLSLATMGLQMSFLNEIEDNLRNLLHLDEFRISRDTLSEMNRQKFEADTNEVYNVQIGKYISNKLMVKYTHGINYDLNRVGLQYDLNKNVGILGEYDRRNGFDVKVEMQWKF